MAFDPGNESGAPIASINVTPLVDVILVLLVVLMVAASGAISEALPLDLPQAASGKQEPTLLRVGIGPDGALSLDGRALGNRPASLGFIRDAAADALEHDAGVRAAIAADGAARHEQVVAVMDALRQGGIEKLAIQVSAQATP